MLPFELGFNLALCALDLAVLAWIRARLQARLQPELGTMARAAGAAVLLPILSWGLLALVLALVFALGVRFMLAFFLARLLAWGLFCHGPLCWAGLAWLLGTRGESSAADGEPRVARAPRAALGAGLVALILAGVGVQAFLIEPHWLEVRRVALTSPRLTRPLKLVILADLQTDQIGPYERQVLARIAAEEPDLLLLAGDYLQCWDLESYEREATALRAALAAAGIAPRLGTFAVGGDCESLGWQVLFAGTGVEPLIGVATIGSELRLQGLTLAQSAREAPPLPASERFTIVLGHRPDFALLPTSGDLLLAGHTHGGQVRLPFVGPLVTLSRVPRAWAGGEPTALPGGATLIVSRGVGMVERAARRHGARDGAAAALPLPPRAARGRGHAQRRGDP